MPLPTYAGSAITRPAFDRSMLVVCCVSLVALAACDDGGVRITTTNRETDTTSKGVLKVVDALQCPDSMGSLTRKGSAQADGTVCTYSGPRGAEVSLHLVTLADDPVETVLGRFETLLTAAMPQAAANIAAAAADDARRQAEAARADADAARTDAQSARADAAASANDRASVSGPGVNIQAEGDRARVSLPGIHVDADGDKANVRIGGFSIQTSESNVQGSNGNPSNDPASNVRVRGNIDAGDGQQSVNIQANDNGAEIRTRAPGEATRQTWLLTGNAASDTGWRMVGYEARGPRGGPIVVATVRARERHADRIFDDAKDLVTLNVGE